jgi:hypothetical protein
LKPLRISAEVVDRVLEHIAAWGRDCGHETGGFLLAKEAAPDILVIGAIAGAAGITRASQQFRISPQALEQLFIWVEDRQLTIPAQFHSHSGPAFLSPTDEAHGFSVEGFVSVVVPRYRKPIRNPQSWGWWQYTEKRWMPIAAARRIETTGAGIVVFDEAGAHEI